MDHPVFSTESCELVEQSTENRALRRKIIGNQNQRSTRTRLIQTGAGYFLVFTPLADPFGPLAPLAPWPHLAPLVGLSLQRDKSFLRNSHFCNGPLLG